MIKLFKKSRVIAVLLIVLILGSGAVFAQDVDSDMGNAPGADTEKAPVTAGRLALENVLQLHPETQDLYQKYTEDLAAIQESGAEDMDSQITELNQKYIASVTDKIQADLDQFTENQKLDVLLINDTIVSGNQEIDPAQLADVPELSSEFENYLIESNN